MRRVRPATKPRNRVCIAPLAMRRPTAGAAVRGAAAPGAVFDPPRGDGRRSRRVGRSRVAAVSQHSARDGCWRRCAPHSGDDGGQRQHQQRTRRGPGTGRRSGIRSSRAPASDPCSGISGATVAHRRNECRSEAAFPCRVSFIVACYPFAPASKRHHSSVHVWSRAFATESPTWSTSLRNHMSCIRQPGIAAGVVSPPCWP